MAFVLLSVGSNIDRELNIRSGIHALRMAFGELKCSPVYESEAVGFDGANFLNLVVALNTAQSVAELSAGLREIENTHGRNRGEPKFSSRTLDIDILTYDNSVGVVDGVELPRREILKNAFVLLPMADLVPDERHPQVNKTYAQLWREFGDESQKLWEIPLSV
ncbi:2-amino-4-hydroxy-6-hydroxymethyldihydropteridine diphosphokinase [Teredinibacter turnerae]|uniref:2-amino-4-hydroxy-6- hydroxymethyldihydropteridine diphosphokinase n=1 Tax=Teredinibacter turnerae TaxID=2426 RepID=UPI0030D2A3B4